MSSMRSDKNQIWCIRYRYCRMIASFLFMFIWHSPCYAESLSDPSRDKSWKFPKISVFEKSFFITEVFVCFIVLVSNVHKSIFGGFPLPGSGVAWASDRRKLTAVKDLINVATFLFRMNVDTMFNPTLSKIFLLALPYNSYFTITEMLLDVFWHLIQILLTTTLLSG